MEQTQDSDILSVFNDPSSIRKMMNKLDGPAKREYNIQLKQKVKERVQQEENERNFKTERMLEIDKQLTIAAKICLIVCLFSFMFYVHYQNTNDIPYTGQDKLAHFLGTFFVCGCIFLFSFVPLEEHAIDLATKYDISPARYRQLLYNRRLYQT